jgi:hypothetical protein
VAAVESAELREELLASEEQPKLLTEKVAAQPRALLVGGPLAQD